MGGVIEILMCVCPLPLCHLHCLPYGYNYVTKTNTQGNAQLTSLVLKILVWKLQKFRAYHESYSWQFWQKTDTSMSLALLQVYWQVKCCFSSTITEPTIMSFDPTCDSLGGGNGCSFGAVLQPADNYDSHRQDFSMQLWFGVCNKEGRIRSCGQSFCMA